jgi:3D-(3,5/4)-trihydroxycyclohexane-1,2-dione acylhydrolase (decyclizing)
MQAAGRHFGCEMRRRVGTLDEGALEGEYLQLDLAAVASGLGASTYTAGTAEELRQALAAARVEPGPVVIVVPTSPHASLPGAGAWWDVAPAEMSGQPSVAEKRQAYEIGLTQQRWFA